VWSPETVEPIIQTAAQGAHIAGYALPDFGESLGEREQNAGSMRCVHSLRALRCRCSARCPRRGVAV